MQYRIKEVKEPEATYFYPQYKKFLFWRRFVWWGGEDGYTPKTVWYKYKEEALEAIENDKIKRREKALEVPKKTIYHCID
tara:strand:+ start:819 stop:1058 length:240 start_codon:yes stop_codon:yes gene_type:complete